MDERIMTEKRGSSDALVSKSGRRLDFYITSVIRNLRNYNFVYKL